MMTNRINFLLCVGIIAAALCYEANLVADSNLWGHLKFGCDFLDRRSLIYLDPYSYTCPGAPWIDPNWLFETTIAFIYRHWAAQGLAACRFVLLAGVWASLLYPLSKSAVPLLVRIMLLALAVVLSQQAGLSALRPELLSFLLFTIELLVLRATGQEKIPQLWLLSLPALLALWINIDSGAIVGLAVFLVWLASALADSPKSLQISLAAAFLSVVACLLTPYGFQLLAFAAKAYLGTRLAVIPESHSLHFASVLGVCYLLFCLIPIWTLVKRSDMLKRSEAISLVLCLFLPAISLTYLFYAVSAGMVLSYPAWSQSLDKEGRLSKALTLLTVPSSYRSPLIVVLSIASLFGLGYRLYQSKALTVSDALPVAAASLLEKDGITGNLACYYIWGDYCLWRLYPRIRVSMDSRWDTVYSPQAFDENIAFTDAFGPWNQLLQQHPPAAVLTSPEVPTYSLMRLMPGWKLVFQDKLSAVFLPTAKTTGPTGYQESARDKANAP